jgi:hypothetical protein
VKQLLSKISNQPDSSLDLKLFKIEMAPWEEFDTTFSFKEDCTYDTKVIDQILSNRQALDNLLFIDRLLKVLGIDAGDTQSLLAFKCMTLILFGQASRAYPPRSNQSLRSLYEQIVASSSPNHHKQSVIYYLLRDCRQSGDGDPSLQFARRCYLSEKYRLLINGLWHMDRLEFKVGLDCLLLQNPIANGPTSSAPWNI